jgi:hypothetical protein
MPGIGVAVGVGPCGGGKVLVAGATAEDGGANDDDGAG